MYQNTVLQQWLTDLRGLPRREVAEPQHGALWLGWKEQGPLRLCEGLSRLRAFTRLRSNPSLCLTFYTVRLHCAYAVPLTDVTSRDTEIFLRNRGRYS